MLLLFILRNNFLHINSIQAPKSSIIRANARTFIYWRRYFRRKYGSDAERRCRCMFQPGKQIFPGFFSHLGIAQVISCVSHQMGDTKTAMAKFSCFLLVTCSMIKPGVFPFGYINHTHHFIGYLKSAHDRH